MATGEDWNTRRQRVVTQFEITLPDLITTYELKTRSLNDLVNQTQILEDDIGKLTNEVKRAETEASTADREFIERRKTMPDPWKPAKVATMQDYTFLFFFVSFFVFLVAVSMVAQEKMKTFGAGILIMLVVVAFLYRYV